MSLCRNQYRAQQTLTPTVPLSLVRSGHKEPSRTTDISTVTPVIIVLIKVLRA